VWESIASPFLTKPTDFEMWQNKVMERKANPCQAITLLMLPPRTCYENVFDLLPSNTLLFVSAFSSGQKGQLNIIGEQY